MIAIFYIVLLTGWLLISLSIGMHYTAMEGLLAAGAGTMVWAVFGLLFEATR